MSLLTLTCLALFHQTEGRKRKEGGLDGEQVKEVCNNLLLANATHSPEPISSLGSADVTSRFWEEMEEPLRSVSPLLQVWLFWCLLLCFSLLHPPTQADL